MALSKAALKRIIGAVPEPEDDDVGKWVVGVIRSIEAEVRKQDDALIRQMLDALELPGTKNHQMLLQCAAAERAARARLEGKP